MSASYASVSYDIFLQTKFISSLLEKNKKTCIVCQKCPANSPTIPLDVLSFHLTTAHLIHCGHKCVFCFCKFQWCPPKEVGIKVQTSYLTFVKHRYECLQNLLQVSSCVATQKEDVFSRRPAIRLQLQTDANSYFLLGKRKTLDWRLPDAQMLQIKTLDKKCKFTRHAQIKTLDKKCKFTRHAQIKTLDKKCKFTRHASPMEELPSFPNSETRETMEKLSSFQNNETRDTMEKLPSFQNNETLETTPEHINRQASELAKDEECKRLRKQLDETQDALQDAHQQLLYIQDLLQEIQEDLVEPSANDTISWIFKKMLTL
ncbi:hypothetical protein JTE90_019195 [Oedothorax gibbosus]|uniref:Uncharacterized protein n=1 Tax=Oedothorax gibbosus TaxID=931172 RepID=A0AAV6TNV0_9ARAC|nr:hypothetical protein JTE90_019195 [Oedothorax gibbosus]